MRFLPWIFVLFWLCGCGAGAEVRHVATAAAPPSNVAVYLTVTEDGNAVKGLKADDFRVIENGTELSSETIEPRLLDRDVGVVRHTVLLVDSTGLETDEQVDDVARAVSIFARRVGATQAATVYAFGSTDELVRIADYAPEGGQGERPVSLSAVKSGASRNLNGAILQGIAKLEELLAAHADVLRRGTLVVFTAGKDTAHRVSDVKVDLAFQELRVHRVLAVGLDWREVNRIGRDGAYSASSFDDLLEAFTRAAADIEADYQGAYLLEYCSPARSGRRLVRVEVLGDAQRRRPLGAVDTEYDATGFSAECKPSSAPIFASSPPGDEPEPERATTKVSRPASPPASKTVDEPAEAPEPPDPNDGFVP